MHFNMPIFCSECEVFRVHCQTQSFGAGGVWVRAMNRTFWGCDRCWHIGVYRTVIWICIFLHCVQHITRTSFIFIPFEMFMTKVMSRKTNVQAYTLFFWCGPVSILWNFLVCWFFKSVLVPQNIFLLFSCTGSEHISGLGKLRQLYSSN